jgi:hypothetical protein
MLGNKEQWMSMVRWALTLIGGYIVSSGYIKGEDWSSLNTAILTIAGAIIAVAPAIQSMIAKTKKNQVITVSQLPEVAAVVVKDSVPSTAPVKVAAETIGEAQTAKVVTESQVKS